MRPNRLDEQQMQVATNAYYFTNHLSTVWKNLQVEQTENKVTDYEDVMRQSITV